MDMLKKCFSSQTHNTLPSPFLSLSLFSAYSFYDVFVLSRTLLHTSLKLIFYVLNLSYFLSTSSSRFFTNCLTSENLPRLQSHSAKCGCHAKISRSSSTSFA